jgi:hypothetical protein
VGVPATQPAARTEKMMYTHVLNRSPLDGISPGDLLKQNRFLSDLTDTPLFDSSL